MSKLGHNGSKFTLRVLYGMKSLCIESKSIVFLGSVIENVKQRYSRVGTSRDGAVNLEYRFYNEKD